MIVCPNCNHPNPDGAVQCEACYTPLPATNNCPNCGATVQADAAFCGQCGYNLRANAAAPPTAVAATVAPDIPLEVPPLVTPDPLVELVQPDPLAVPNPVAASSLPPTAVAVPPEVPVVPVAPPPVAPPVAPPPVVPVAVEITPAPEPVAVIPEPEPVAVIPEPEPVAAIPEPEPVAAIPEPEPVAEIPEPEPVAAVPPAPAVSPARTQLQQITAQLFHVQSDTNIELPQTLSVIHIGKPNDRIPPDVDVSGFPNSEIVSRIHSDIRVEGDAFYIEDVGSSNGTYINNLPLLPGNRHRLRPGDRISLGKGDLVTFLFQLS
ncbi:FHA domain-containing protein [Calothrix sp. FACHB-1219]|uniref:FHA domain-containing protein n=1 Tax=unclassified Calothrix TaxID=2619626 RepID=UPI001689D4D4|nr:MULTISPECIES: FHA domain-containing protein [unclassified Calothrix]MBD2205382.1 FHA domain-containing protein [Calothrix sp. FACHB-168]MBD2218513.1 FHA domain-containing protein [Calothrix sp. FACHB-1219]